MNAPSTAGTGSSRLARLASLASVASVAALLAACGSERAPQPTPPMPVAPAEPAPPPAVDAAAPDAAAPAAPEATMPKGPDAFTFRLYAALGAKKGNLFYSGTSLSSALGMTTLGAKGETKKEFDETLGLPADEAAHVAQAKAEAAAWKASAGKSELAIANRVWVDKKSVLEPAFVKSAEAGYGASAENVDFVGASEASRLKVNAWVEKATKTRIKDLLPKGSVTPDTRLVLTNAVYFKGSWADAFPKKATQDDTFHAGDAGGDVKVPFMNRSGSYKSAEVDGTQVLELPYKDSDLGMIVILPKDGELAKVEQRLASGGFDGLVAPLAQGKVAVSLPKFSFTWGGSVKTELQGLGLKTAFSMAADLSGLRKPTNEPPLFVSDVFHKAFVQVDETGTEAAAATGVVVATRAMAQEKAFKADHPFVFAIRDAKTGRVLFVGRVANPKG